ncbi:carrier protein [Thecamonas trahens ATCC 50062]|uniref:Carrier protein n=1 Tax=Thecamonas trahens ATCC 50062 TaxID=461836 RepID=A0A0L0D897_THETB|nr:carrier protein [Thecamonas trahens ATCC 50062]KNC48465.1 carrier protein [Thecamonas trahens ATCC 50062]|eukprot:XP_013758578.1 carrier protein [Thecamonas trahens ATCC 50062]
MATPPPQAIPLVASNDEVEKKEVMSASETALRLLLAGAGAGAVTKTCVAPLERVKIIFQVQGMARVAGAGATAGLTAAAGAEAGTTSAAGAAAGARAGAAAPAMYDGVIPTLVRLFREEGVRGLFRGNGANVVRVIPVYALKFTLNDEFKAMFSPTDGSKPSFATLVASGSLAGLVQTSITHPIDTVRARLTMPASLGHYKGIVHCATETIRSEGFAALYKGFLPTIVSATPYVGLQMGIFGQLKSWLDAGPGSASVVGNLLCGAGAGLIAQSVTFPGDVVRRRMQLSGMGGAQPLYPSTMACIRHIAKHEGAKAFTNGMGVNAIRCLPGAAIQFAVYNYLRDVLNIQPH